MEEALCSNWTTNHYSLFLILKKKDSYTYSKLPAEMGINIAKVLFQDGVPPVKQVRACRWFIQVNR